MGDSYTLNAVVSPENAGDKTVTFSSNDDKIATVTPKLGKVTAVAAGSVEIFATTSNGIVEKCVVTVTEAG